MEESNIKEINNEKPVYRLNREQRRKAEREQRRLNKKRNKANNKSKVNSKVKEIIEAIKSKAIDVKNETGIDKMYFCINADNIKDCLIVKYEGSEELKKSLGLRTDITLDDGTVRKNNIVLYVEVTIDNVVNIEDGSGVYLDIDIKN